MAPTVEPSTLPVALPILRPFLFWERAFAIVRARNPVSLPPGHARSVRNPDRSRQGRNEYGVAAKKHGEDRKSTRLNSSHLVISYAVFCLKQKNTHNSRRH